jgi:hypothetical protein
LPTDLFFNDWLQDHSACEHGRTGRRRLFKTGGHGVSRDNVTGDKRSLSFGAAAFDDDPFVYDSDDSHAFTNGCLPAEVR